MKHRWLSLKPDQAVYKYFGELRYFRVIEEVYDATSEAGFLDTQVLMPEGYITTLILPGGCFERTPTLPRNTWKPS